MNIRKYLTALLLSAVAAAAPAGAAPVVNTYQVVSAFGGTLGTVTQRYTLAFDPAVATGPISVLSYFTSTNAAQFNPVGGVLFTSSPSSSVYAGSTVAVGGAVDGVAPPAAGSFDFRTLFFVSPANGAIAGGGQLIPFNAETESAGGGPSTFTFDVAISLVASSVPEAATWATMLVGLGVAGAALRRRRARAAITAAA